MLCRFVLLCFACAGPSHRHDPRQPQRAAVRRPVLCHGVCHRLRHGRLERGACVVGLVLGCCHAAHRVWRGWLVGCPPQAHAWYLGFYAGQTVSFDQASTQGATQLTLTSATRFNPSGSGVYVVELIGNTGGTGGNLYVSFIGGETFHRQV